MLFTASRTISIDIGDRVWYDPGVRSAWRSADRVTAITRDAYTLLRDQSPSRDFNPNVYSDAVIASGAIQKRQAKANRIH